MSKTKSKQDKDPSSSSASVTLAELSSLLAEQRKAISADFKSSFEALTTTLDGLNSTVAGHGERIGSLEDNSNEVDRRLQHLENACSTLQQDNVLLKTKLADLERRSRRQNIRIIGLPESLEGPRPTAFFSQLLVDVFGKEVLSSPPELDRAHRSLAPKPAAGDKPRPVIVRLHRFQVKDLLIREARRRGAQDLTLRGLQQRCVEGKSRVQKLHGGTLQARVQTGSPVSSQAPYYPPQRREDMDPTDTFSQADMCQNNSWECLLYSFFMWLLRLRCNAFLERRNNILLCLSEKDCYGKQATLSKDIAELQSKSVVVKGCLKIWNQFRRHFGLQITPVSAPVHSNPLFTPSVIDRAFLIWKDLGIVSIKQLYISGIFASFDQLTQAFNLQRTHFFRYLQVRNFVRNHFPGFPALPPSTLVDTILDVNPNRKACCLSHIVSKTCHSAAVERPLPPLSFSMDKGCPSFYETGEDKYSLRFSEQKFYKIWQPFLDP
ncbi:hypothetical protein F7725_015243 [Dissostichus mawsoni]|uniref:Transposase n=1 Tax=Dissostichus mawsoni TaxID=36200 RepID=A0A7J5YGW5_DISMA|nr:hypothetical protein F7725_015243 [Dissostichus mawsoni]